MHNTFLENRDKWIFSSPPVCFVSFLALLVCLFVLNATFKNISAILVEETGENHRPVASHWQTLSCNVVHLALIKIRTHSICGDRHRLHIGSLKSNYHTITTTSAPFWLCFYNCVFMSVQEQLECLLRNSKVRDSTVGF